MQNPVEIQNHQIFLAAIFNMVTMLVAILKVHEFGGNERVQYAKNSIVKKTTSQRASTYSLFFLTWPLSYL